MAKAIKSLNDAVDRLEHARFFGKPLSRGDEQALAQYIAQRQGGVGAYARSFALTPQERTAGFRAFTGELFTSASARHIAGEECCRVLAALPRRGAEADRALKTARANMNARILRAVDDSSNIGTFCCGKCTVAFWRHIAAGGFNKRERRLAEGMRRLRKGRDGKGGWKRFPFYYTLLGLTEIGPEVARPELEYAATVLRRRLARKPAPGKYARRRREVMARALAMAA
jgi:hypothetical protein